jgi:aminomethyltransferase
MSKSTQLHGYHAEHAKLTEFAGYEMPLWYTTTTDEHLAVRNSSGIFDVSHMGRFMVKGAAATSFLESLVPTDVGSQPPGKAFYTLLLNDMGGIIDDLITVRLKEDSYLLVVNAANAQVDMQHITSHAPGGLGLEDMTASTAMFAVQGPKALESLQPLTDLDLGQLKRFRSAETRIMGAESLVSRTGYTGEDGFEVIVYDSTNERPEKAANVWEKLATTSTPCGLGARDSLRLEAGFPLHGSDMDQGTNPFEADLAWVLSPGKTGYVGSDAISEFRSAPPGATRRGLVLASGIPRHGFEVVDAGAEVGTVTSGTFSPILHRGIALARVRQDHSNFGTKVSVLVRESPQEGTIVKPPFYDEQVYGWKRQKGK